MDVPFWSNVTVPVALLAALVTVAVKVGPGLSNCVVLAEVVRLVLVVFLLTTLVTLFDVLALKFVSPP